MGTPTHVQVIVKRARNLKIKGKDETNDAFVIIGLGKEKFRTSTKEKTTKSAEWLEECELLIPRHGNTAEIILKVMHQGGLGSHHFLGMVTIPLKDLINEDDTVTTNLRPITRWYLLKCKPNQSKKDYRGELEVTISFLEKQLPKKPEKSVSFLSVNEGSSQMDSKGSLQSLNKFTNKIGGSLASLGHHDKRLWKKKHKGSTNSLPRNLTAASRFGGSLVSVNSSSGFSDSLENLGGGEVLRKGSIISHNSTSSANNSNSSTLNISNKQPLDQVKEEEDDNEDEWNTKLSSSEKDNLNVPKRKVSSVIKDFISSSTVSKNPKEKKEPKEDKQTKPSERKKIPFHSDEYPKEAFDVETFDDEKKDNNVTKDDNENIIKAPTGKQDQFSGIGNDIPPPKPPRVVIGKELSAFEKEGAHDRSTMEQARYLNSFKDKSREDLIEILVNLQRKLESDSQKINDLEEYVASLLVKVLTNAPQILEHGSANPYSEGSKDNIEFSKLHRKSF